MFSGMRLTSAPQIVFQSIKGNSARTVYWNVMEWLSDARALLWHSDAAVRKKSRDDLIHYMFGMRSHAHDQGDTHLHLAADWLLLAQTASADGGVSLGYFPSGSDPLGWRPSYPETTGYIITSLLKYAKRFNKPHARDAALKMSQWEASIQMASGAVQGGPVTVPEKQSAAAFNTGMVLDGWCSVLEEGHDPAIENAARRAADFLTSDLNSQGYFTTNGAFVSTGEVKTYTCLCAWALYRIGDIVDEDRYRKAAVKSIEAALRQQQESGWFAHNCLNRSDAPLTHTIGYTLQGIFEVGVLAGREDFISAVGRCFASLARQIQPSGYLAGRFFSNWQPAGFSSCLTGNAQLAIVGYRLAQETGLGHWAEAARKLVDFLKKIQITESSNLSLVGALPGSFPILGDYMRAGYPNWATKYLLDALMLDMEHTREL